MFGRYGIAEKIAFIVTHPNGDGAVSELLEQETMLKNNFDPPYWLGFGKPALPDIVQASSRRDCLHRAKQVQPFSADVWDDVVDMTRSIVSN